MNFDDTPQEAAFRAEARAWIQVNAPKELEAELSQPTVGRIKLKNRDILEESKKWQKKKADAGWACIRWPKEYGGRGATAIQQVIWNQEEARFRTPPNIFGITHGMCAPTVMTHGTDEQKRRYLPPMLRGDEIWCQGFSEPDNGSDLANVQTTAVRDGDDYVLNGTKIWTSLGTEAKHMILLARTDPEAGSKYQGLTFFLAPVDVPGVRKSPIRKMTGEFGFNETHFENARIPASCVLGEEGQGWMIAMATLAFERGAAERTAGGLDMEVLRTEAMGFRIGTRAGDIAFIPGARPGRAVERLCEGARLAVIEVATEHWPASKVGWRHHLTDAMRLRAEEIWPIDESGQSASGREQ